MATTYNLISKQTVGVDGVTSVSFSNIPQTYTDLVLYISDRNVASGSAQIYIKLNGSTSSYTYKALYTASGSAGGGSGTDSASYVEDNASMTASTFSSGYVYIPNYTSSNYKSYSIDGVQEGNTANVYTWLQSSLWSNTSAVTSITFTENGSGFKQYTTFYLYGVSNSSTQNTSVPYATGGDVITTDGTYWYHAFKYSGTFTPLKALSCDVLVVAGGGSGGSDLGGGGGAGGLLGFTNQALLTQAYTVTVGGGGPTQSTSSTNGNNGNDSQFGSLTLVKGGGGGGHNDTGGNNGGSGGGAGRKNYSPGSGTSSQGYAGGIASYGSYNADLYYTGGGGGAGAVGGDADRQSAGKSGDGGAGLSTYSSWGSATYTGQNQGGTYYYAGGGGGGNNPSQAGQPGSGGLGGGGNGNSNHGGTGGTAGTANTGGGGGGGSSGGSPGNAGGSGIVIVRYAV